MTNADNMNITFEIEQTNNSQDMLFNSLVLLLSEYKFYKSEMVENIQTDRYIDIMNCMLEKAKTIIELMKVEVKI